MQPYSKLLICTLPLNIMLLLKFKHLYLLTLVFLASSCSFLRLKSFPAFSFRYTIGSDPLALFHAGTPSSFLFNVSPTFSMDTFHISSVSCCFYLYFQPYQMKTKLSLLGEGRSECNMTEGGTENHGCFGALKL